MKVVTLDSEAFGQACARLQAKVEADGYKPDLVVAIATGGVYVGRLMMADVRHVEVCRRRPSSSLKGRLVKAVVRSLPRCVQNALRIVEARVLGLRRQKPSAAEPPIVPDPGFAPCRVLVLDDAVDSGATLLAVLEAVRGRWPEAEVRSAVITVTTDSPLAAADYSIYNNHSLIRFPWSIDA